MSAPFHGHDYLLGFQSSAIDTALMQMERGKIGDAQLTLHRAQEERERIATEYAEHKAALNAEIDRLCGRMPVVAMPLAPGGEA